MNLSLLFISSGLFLGWSLGANDAANLFGTAVGTKVVKFKSAALIMSVFIIIGAVASGSGASHTLGKLGEISSLPGAFIVALSSAITVFYMTKYGLPVSTSQSIVGAIIGWNFFSNIATDFEVLSKILLTWVLCPLLAAFFQLFSINCLNYLQKMSLNIFLRYYYVRIGLILVGAFGAYALGANNIGNVMGVFTNAVAFESIDVWIFSFNETQILFFLGGLAIATGIFTYSKNVMHTIGKDIYKISPATALIVVLSSAFVLFIFASEGLESFLISMNLPTIPLVPVSSSQAVVGAIIGISIGKGDRNINFTRIKKLPLAGY